MVRKRSRLKDIGGFKAVRPRLERKRLEKQVGVIQRRESEERRIKKAKGFLSERQFGSKVRIKAGRFTKRALKGVGRSGVRLGKKAAKDIISGKKSRVTGKNDLLFSKKRKQKKFRF